MNIEWNPFAADYVSARISGCERGFGNSKSAFVVDDVPIAGVVFHNWSPESKVIEISSAADSPKWFSRDIIGKLLDYAYNDCGCQMVVARISENNTRARRLWKALGATEYVIPRLRGRNESEAILTLTDDDWAESRLKR